MNKTEAYEFDRSGYIVIPGLLSAEAVTQLADAVDRLEKHALAHKDKPPRLTAPWGTEYHVNESCGYHVHASEKSGGGSMLIEDFFNFDSAFDQLVNEPKTMTYINAIVQERPRLIILSCAFAIRVITRELIWVAPYRINIVMAIMGVASTV